MFVFSAVKSIGSVQMHSPTQTLTQIYLVITPFSHVLTAILIWYPSRQYTKIVKQVSMYFWNKFHFLTNILLLKYNFQSFFTATMYIYILSSHSTLLYKPRDLTSILKALPGKLNIKRHSPSIRYIITFHELTWQQPQPLLYLNLLKLKIIYHECEDSSRRSTFGIRLKHFWILNYPMQNVWLYVLKGSNCQCLSFIRMC